jgi:RNA binding exosome subunit
MLRVLYSVVRVKSVNLSVMCYATEDLTKVAKGLGIFLDILHYSTKLTTLKAEGHYGDEISILSINLKNQEAEACAKRIFSHLDQEAIRTILNSAELRFDGSKLFLRFSKFDAYFGRIVLASGGDAIKVVVGFNGYLKGKSYDDILKEAGLIGEKYA